MCTRYRNQAVILSIRITFVAPWHVFLHTFLTSILRVGCPLQTTGLVVARARLQRLCRSSTQIQLSTLFRNGCWKNSAGLPTVRSTLLSLSVLFVGCCWITPNQRQRIRKCPVAWVTEQRRCDIWCLPEYNQALLSGLHTHYIFNPPRVTLLAQLMLVSDTLSTHSWSMWWLWWWSTFTVSVKKTNFVEATKEPLLRSHFRAFLPSFSSHIRARAGKGML